MTDLSISNVLAWARTKPPTETYEYTDISSCALSQFLRDSGSPSPIVTAKYYQRTPTEPYRVVDVELNEAVGSEPHDFGALVARLERANAVPAPGFRPSDRTPSGFAAPRFNPISQGELA